jgi:hypothetical protein
VAHPVRAPLRCVAVRKHQHHVGRGPNVRTE